MRRPAPRPAAPPSPSRCAGPSLSRAARGGILRVAKSDLRSRAGEGLESIFAWREERVHQLDRQVGRDRRVGAVGFGPLLPRHVVGPEHPVQPGQGGGIVAVGHLAARMVPMMEDRGCDQPLQRAEAPAHIGVDEKPPERPDEHDHDRQQVFVARLIGPVAAWLRELDRILGDERNFAGTSFIRAGDIGTLRYGSLVEVLLYDIRRTLTLAGPSAVYVDRQAEIAGAILELAGNVVERVRTVDFRLAQAQQVEVRAVEDEYRVGQDGPFD